MLERLLLATCCVLLSACLVPEEDDTTTSPSPVVSPTPTQASVAVTFDAVAGADEISCGSTHTGLGSAGTDVLIHDFRFYVSNVRMLDDDMNEYPVTLADDGQWQYQNVALLDFEDGTTECPMGNAGMNDTLIGSAQEADWTGIRFDLGIPFELNHLDVTAQPAPLDVPAMYWVWQTGYKFLRIDLEDTGTTNPWNVHVGSTLCGSAGGSIPPGAECGRPNRATITLTGFDSTADVVQIDLEPLLADSDVSQNLGMPTPGCQTFEHDEPDCTDLFPNLGLNYFTGTCEGDCAAQSAFSVVTLP